VAIKVCAERFSERFAQEGHRFAQPSPHMPSLRCRS
jgi:hypothetical protein